MQRIREKEKAHDDDEQDQALLAAGVKVRLCPRCNTRIEVRFSSSDYYRREAIYPVIGKQM